MTRFGQAFVKIALLCVGNARNSKNKEKKPGC